ncbi:unnamed protein product [Ranitomeya imitator]|uniref:ribonuclease H n=1 Tax=Ranitomeya imitator TaxID=111125 RepID=A0ABN9KUZ3_9NEOB|nr:unnamed protein product [Ranitomeya imitator]
METIRNHTSTSIWFSKELSRELNSSEGRAGHRYNCSQDISQQLGLSNTSRTVQVLASAGLMNENKYSGTRHSSIHQSTLRSTVRYSTLRYSSVWYSTLRYSSVWYSTSVWHSTLRYSSVWLLDTPVFISLALDTPVFISQSGTRHSGIHQSGTRHSISLVFIISLALDTPVFISLVLDTPVFISLALDTPVFISLVLDTGTGIRYSSGTRHSGIHQSGTRHSVFISLVPVFISLVLDTPVFISLALDTPVFISLVWYSQSGTRHSAVRPGNLMGNFVGHFKFTWETFPAAGTPGGCELRLPRDIVPVYQIKGISKLFKLCLPKVQCFCDSLTSPPSERQFNALLMSVASLLANVCFPDPAPFLLKGPLVYTSDRLWTIMADEEGRQHPRSLQGLLHMAIEAGTESGSDLQTGQMSDERRQWLQEAMSSAFSGQADEVQQMKECLKSSAAKQVTKMGMNVRRKPWSYSQTYFCKLGGMSLMLTRYLSRPEAELRWRTADLIGICSQNVPFVQEMALSLGAVSKLLELLDLDTSETVRIKALFAISCLVREQEAGLAEFVKLDGFSVLMRAMQTHILKLKIKSAFLLQNLLISHPEYKSTLCAMGMIQQLVSLLRTEHSPFHEHVLSALCSMATDFPRGVAECQAPELAFEDLLKERCKMVEKQEEYQEELDYCEQLLKICFGDNPEDNGMDRTKILAHKRAEKSGPGSVPHPLAHQSLSVWRRRGRPSAPWTSQTLPVRLVSAWDVLGEALSDAPSEDISELDPNQIATMSETVQNLIGAINQTCGIKDPSTEPADQAVSFRRAKPPSKFFAPHPEFEEILSRERENPTRRFQRGKRLGVLYPFSPDLTANWTVSPSVDPPVSRLSTNTISHAGEYLVSASLDVASCAAQASSNVVAIRRTVWLKAWQADLSSKKSLTSLPFLGSRLFGSQLDQIIKDATGGTSSLLPQAKPSRPPPRRQFRSFRPFRRFAASNSFSQQQQRPQARQERKAVSFRPTPSWRPRFPQGPGLEDPPRHDSQQDSSPTSSLGGRLLLFRDVWISAVEDAWVREVVSSGYKIEFASRPRDRFFQSRPPRDPALVPGFFSAIASLLKSGVIVPVPEKERFTGFYSNLFVVPKKDGKVRPILDLKLLNRRVRLRHFRMESLRSVIASMEAQEFLCSIDIQDAYLHVPIFPGHHRFLRFAVQRDHFQFVALPFGLATVPRVFTKIMAALMAILRVRGLVLFPYLDDILIKAPSFAQAHESLSIVLDTLARFGWLVNRKKSCLIPSQRIIFLGMLLDTRQSRVFLPKDKRSSLCRDIRLLQGPRPPSLRSAMKVLGKMQAILSQWDRSVFSLDRPIRLSSRVKWSLYWWLTSPLISQGRSFLPVHWQVVTTDASLIGWGAVFRHLTVQGRWSSQESTLPINVLEIRAIFLSLRHWERILRGLPVRIQTDNATAVAYVNHQGGDPELLGPCRGIHDPPLGRGNGSGDIRGAYPRRGQLGRRLPQPRGPRGRGMVLASGGLPSDLSSMGDSGCGSHGVSNQQEGSAVRLQVPRSSRSGRRCSGHSLVTVRAALPAPTPSITSQAFEEDQSGRGAGHPDRPGLAQESLVRGARQPSRGRSLAPSRQARSAVPGSDLPPEFSVAQFNGVAVETAVLRASGLSDG